MCQHTYPAPEACVLLLEDSVTDQMKRAPDWVARSYFLTVRDMVAWALPQATPLVRQSLANLFAETAGSVLPSTASPQQVPASLEEIIQAVHDWPRLSQQLGAYSALFLFLSYLQLPPDVLEIHVQSAMRYAVNRYTDDFRRPELRPWIDLYFALREKLADEPHRRLHACAHCAAACA